MRRRDALSLLGGAAVLWPRVGSAQQSEPVRRIAVLVPLPETAWLPVWDELRQHGYVEGATLSLDRRGFEARYETELANDFGNLASRVLAMVDRYRDGTVPKGQVDAVLAEDFEGTLARLSDLVDRAELSQALEVVWVLVRRLNRYVEETAPWVLAKDEADPARLEEVLYNLVEGLRVVTLMLVPYLPDTAETLLATLGEEGRGLAELGSRGGGQTVERISPLFPKIETPAA